MKKMHSFFTNVMIIVIIIGIEMLCRKLELPITVLDFLLTPLIVIFGVFIIKRYFFDTSEDVKHQSPSMSVMARLGYMLLGVMFFLLGLWSIWQGSLDPLAYFSSIKGALHGYSLFILGVFICFISLVIIYSHIKVLIKKSEL